MHPDFLDIGFLHFKSYGVCMAAGIMLCWHIVEKLSGGKDLSSLILSLVFSGILGARAAYVIEHWDLEFASFPEKIIRVDQGGLMFYGGLILAMAVFFAWCLLKKQKPLAMADLFATVVPLGHAMGRIGCFMNGCCYGRDSGAWCAVTYPAGSPSWHEHGGMAVSVLPTQLFEAAALFVLFGALMLLYRRCRRYTAGVYLVGYAFIRFGMEYLRGDPRAAVGPFSISQTISIAMFFAGAALLAASFRSRDK